MTESKDDSLIEVESWGAMAAFPRVGDRVKLHSMAGLLTITKPLATRQAHFPDVVFAGEEAARRVLPKGISPQVQLTPDDK